MENQVQVIPSETQQAHDMAIIREPEVVLQEAARAAKALKDVVSKKSKPVIFNGEQFLEYEDLLVLGQFYGYAVRTHDAVPCEIDGVKGAKAKAELINMKTGEIIGGAEAYCLRDERNWKEKPWFQLASMAQTRAGAKSLRNRLSWVVVLAGYKPTPAEEMNGEETNTPAPQPAVKAVPVATDNADVQRVEFVPTKIDVKQSANGTSYWIICNGNDRYRTFDKTDGQVAGTAMKDGRKVVVEYKEGKFGKEVKFLAWADPMDAVIAENDAIEIVGE